VPSATVFLCYLVLAYDGRSINGIISPLVLVAIMAYFVTCMFTEIFSMGIDTLLICFIADEEMFPPAERSSSSITIAIIIIIA
jgi:choline transporter-like protein 2/4/5